MKYLADTIIEEKVAGKISDFCQKIGLKIEENSILEGIESVVTEGAKKIKIVLSKILAKVLKIPMTVIRCKCLDQIPKILEEKTLLTLPDDEKSTTNGGKKKQKTVYRRPIHVAWGIR